MTQNTPFGVEVNPLLVHVNVFIVDLCGFGRAETNVLTRSVAGSDWLLGGE